MINAILILVILALPITVYAYGTTYVKPYSRSDGTYVPGHYRTNPNSSFYDNWSTKGNANPYTGQKGYVDPYKNFNPSSNYPSNSWKPNTSIYDN